MTKRALLFNLICLLFFTALAPRTQAAPQAASAAYTSEILDTLYRHGDGRDFNAFDGTRINFTVFRGVTNSLKRPLVIVPGRGESIYRYVEFVKKFLDKGYGPIFVLDHRGQGFSQKMKDQKGMEYIEDFDLYIKDLIDFLDGPVKEYLRNMGMGDLIPYLIAHSMGGAVLDLAMLARPDLTERIAYISPMFGINTHSSVLNLFHDWPARILTKFLCSVGCDHLRLGAKYDHVNTNNTERHIFALQMEDLLGIHMFGSGVHWVQQNLAATERVRANATKQTTASLIIVAENDDVVRDDAIYEYSCAAQNCTLTKIPGGHSPHQQPDSILDLTVTLIDDFLQAPAATPVTCLNTMAVSETPQLIAPSNRRRQNSR